MGVQRHAEETSMGTVLRFIFLIAGAVSLLGAFMQFSDRYGDELVGIIMIAGAISSWLVVWFIDVMEQILKQLKAQA